MRNLNPIDLRLYLVIGPDHIPHGANLIDVVRAAAAGGVCAVQLRDKTSTTRQQIELARAMKQVLADTSIPLLINDRVDVAIAADADGVHVGHDDMEITDARAQLGPDMILGLTVKNAIHADVVDPQIIDYASIGGVFVTKSKVNPDAPVGLLGLSELSHGLRSRYPTLPIGAIAGIDEGKAGDVIAHGADGVAVVSAITMADKVAETTRSFRQIVDHALAARAA